MEKMGEVQFKSPENEDIHSIIGRKIGSIVSDIKLNQDIGEGFDEAAEKLLNLKYESGYIVHDFDRSWSTGQIDQLIEAYESNRGASKDNTRKSELALWNLFGTETGKPNERASVSNVFAEVLIDRIRSGKNFSKKLGEVVKTWVQDIQMVSPELRVELLSTLIRNPGAASPDVLEDAISVQGLYGQVLIQDLEKELSKSGGDVNKSMGIVDVLEVMAKRINRGAGSGFENAAIESDKALQNIKKKNNNYFISQRLDMIDQIRDGDYQARHLDLMRRYNSNGLQKIAPQPMEAKYHFDPNNFSSQCSYMKAGGQYGIIYNPSGDVDSLFEINERGKENNNLRMEEILERESPETYGQMNEKKKYFLVDNYKALLNVHFRDKIESDFKFDLSEFTIREQLQFVNFISNKSTEEIQAIITNLGNLKGGNAKINCVKSFLSLEYSQDNGGKIITIAENLKADSDRVFSKIAEITEAVENEMDSELFKEETNIDRGAIRLELLKKAHEIIVSLSNALEDKSKNKNIYIQKLLEDLDKSKIEITLLASILKTAKEQGVKLSPEQIRGMKIEMKDIGELAGDKKKEFREKYEGPVMEMMKESYAKIFAENPKAREKVENNFKERFENLEKYRVYVLMFQNEIVAFATIQPIEGKENEVMAESLIVNADVQKYSMGIAFLQKVLEREFAEHKVKIIRGKTRVGLPAGEAYDRIGLVVDKARPSFEEEGIKYEWRIAESPIS